MTLEHAGLDRSALVHLPPNYDDQIPMPLVLAFHGGGGRAEQYARFTGFDTLADEEGFIVVYPRGVNNRWHDARFTEEIPEGDEDEDEAHPDDVGFTLALLDELKRAYAIDEERIYITGMSNGGMFCQQLAIEATEHFAAVASVTAQIPTPRADMEPQGRLSVLLMNGTEDPLVPYEGGDIEIALSERRREAGKATYRGSVLSTEETIDYWLRHNEIADEPVTETLEDKDPDDGARAVVQTWRGEAASVVLYKIVGGGHTYPGGAQYLPQRVIGATCRDFDATEAIWAFFSNHSK
jgi:polyhydroxybutyrate depolymerase